jgi:hypothetical protein
MIKMTPIDIAKFWMKSKEDSSSKIIRDAKKWYGRCWIWQGNLWESGYARYILRQKEYRAHRISYFLTYGIFDESLFVCHKCDNPSCINPQHLFLGTPKENTQDMIDKGRLVRNRGENKGVSLRKSTGKWRARYMNNYKSMLVGDFETKEEALEALRIAKYHLEL